jgi:hypothetical protein
VGECELDCNDTEQGSVSRFDSDEDAKDRILAWDPLKRTSHDINLRISDVLPPDLKVRTPILVFLLSKTET